MRLAVIPARGGSKRIPRKNIRPFRGEPMITWSIRAAKASACFDRIIVSTDDEEIASVARDNGAEVPFMRPPELSDDHASTQAVIRHAIAWASENGDQAPNEVCCHYATAPFVRATDLQTGLAMLRRNRSGYVFPVTTYPFPIQRAVRITASKRIEMFNPEHFSSRSQDLEVAYHDAGQFYWGYAEAWLAAKPIFSEDAMPIILPRQYVQDIDTPEDWIVAELMHQALSASGCEWK